MIPSLDRFEAEFTSTVGFVSGGHLLSHLYIMAYPPLFPLFVDEFGLSNARLGLIVSVMALAMFLFQTPAGELVDRIGAKRVLVLGIFVSAIGTALVGFMESYWGVLVFSLISGIGQSAFHPANYALLSTVSSDDLEGKSYAVHSFAGFVGFALAPVIVGGLGLLYGWQVALIAVGSAGIAYAILVQVVLPPVHWNQIGDTDDPKVVGDLSEELLLLVTPSMLAVFGFYFFISMGSFGIQTFTVVYAVTDLQLSEAVGNTVLTIFFVVSAIGVLLGGVFADQFDFRKVLIGALGLTALGAWTTISSVVTNAATMIVTFSVIGVFFGGALPARDRLVNSFSTPETTGKAFGFAYTGVPLAGFVSPILLGRVIGVTGSARFAFALVGLFFFLAMAIVLAETVVRILNLH